MAISASNAPSVAPLTITLFGPLSVLVGGQPIPHLRSRKAQWLLALLTLRHGKPVQREWLAGTLWPDVDQTQAFANLRPALSELRKALGSEGARLQSPSRNSLLLDLTDVDCDVLRFDAAVARRTSAARQQSVSLYRGTLLEGCTEEWVTPERESRLQECLQALQALATEATEAGDYEAAADHWRRAVALDPLWEAARRGLMEALFQHGDGNAAFQVYREYVASLQRDDPRASPDDETAALYRRLRGQAQRKATASAIPVRAEKTAVPRVSGSLNQALTDLIGRDDERLEVAERLQRSRLVTLTGPGGIGKTRLASAVGHEVAGEYPDGVWLVALDAVSAGDRAGSKGAIDVRRVVTQQIASVLEVKEAVGRPVVSVVTEQLKGKRLLLVLDNCEHLVEACADVVSHLLRECPGLRILATSRETLRLSEENVWQVPGLAAPGPDNLPAGGAALARALRGYDAVHLFVERAESAHKSFALTVENARDVALLCSRLDGIPLAIELAAARVGVLTPAQILAELDAHPLDAFKSRQRDIVPRHRSLRATLEWSYGLLPAPLQPFLAAMGVFRGGWSLEAAQAVCPDADALEMLTILKDASLINTTEKQHGTRFSLLETVRKFAVEELEKSGRAAEVRRAHAEFVEKLLTAETDDHSPEFFLAVERDYANAIAALTWALDAGDEERAVRLCVSFSIFWHYSGRNTEGNHWIEVTLRSFSDAESAGSEAEKQALPTRHRLDLLESRINLLHNQREYIACAEAAYAVYEMHHRAGNPVAGRTHLFNSAVCWSMSDLKRAMPLLEECLPMERVASADGRANPIILVRLSEVAALIGFAERAAAFRAEAIDLCHGREERDPFGCMAAFWYAGRAVLNQGDAVRAQELFEAMCVIAGRMPAKGMEATALCSLGAVARVTGDVRRARELMETATVTAGSEVAFSSNFRFQIERIELLLAEGDWASAVVQARQSLATIRGKAASNRRNLYPLLLHVAEANLAPSTALHNAEQSACLLGAVDGVVARLGLVTPDRAERERAARVRAALPRLLEPERAGAAEAAGAALDDEAALELASRSRI